MSFRFYFPVLAVALAGAVFGLGAMFGLGLLAPSAPPVRAQANVNFTTEPKVVAKEAKIVPKQPNAEDATGKPEPSPIFPVNPGAPRAADNSLAQPTATADQAAPAARADDRMAATDATATKPAAAPAGRVQGIEGENTAAADSDKTVGAAPADTRASAPAAPTNAPPPEKPAAATTLPAAVNHCDVRACASAYTSFRASDCSYQPYQGPRQVCKNPPSARPAVASIPRERRIERLRPREANGDVDDATDAGDAADGASRMTAEQVDIDALPPRREPGRVILIEPAADDD